MPLPRPPPPLRSSGKQEQCVAAALVPLAQDFPHSKSPSSPRNRTRPTDEETSQGCCHTSERWMGAWGTPGHRSGGPRTGGGARVTVGLTSGELLSTRPAPLSGGGASESWDSFSSSSSWMGDDGDRRVLGTDKTGWRACG